MTKLFLYIISIILLTSITNCQQKKMNYNKLTPEEENVIVNKGTERPFTGKYTDFKEKGIYICKRCNTPLYYSSDKFDSECGWPSFDDEIPGAVEREKNAGDNRIEIVCANCKAHLGHVFEGEHLTQKNVRHCVNSISLNFVPGENKAKTETAIFASGCFWGTQYMFQSKKGVITTTVGYTGGHTVNPTYKQVCSDTTGHAEGLQVVFDPKIISYEELAKLFFETHDPTQVGGQGPDLGSQYRSEIFFLNENQKNVAEKLVQILSNKGLKVVTKITKASQFYPAEDYHQDYYNKTGGTPYCHRYIKRF